MYVYWLSFANGPGGEKKSGFPALKLSTRSALPSTTAFVNCGAARPIESDGAPGIDESSVPSKRQSPTSEAPCAGAAKTSARAVPAASTQPLTSIALRIFQSHAERSRLD